MTRSHKLVLLTCFAASVVATNLGAVFAPTLLTFHPLVLVATSPLARHLVIAAADAPAVAFVAVVVARRLWDSAVSYQVGRTYGEQGLKWFEIKYPRSSLMVRRVERWFRRGGAVVVFILPGFAVGFLAGTAGMRRWVFFPVALAGHITWAVGTYLTGDALSPWTDIVITFVRANVALLTLISVVGVAAIVWLRRRGDKRQKPVSD
jgi:membrane protein DedA with SNARE-associated domain